MKEKIKLLILFIVGAFIYMGIELAFRGFTHWSMGIVGGTCFIIIGGLNDYYDREMSIFKMCFLGAIIITALELCAGIVLNLQMKLHIWDYSHMPLNFMGQICLIFSIAWFFLSVIAILLDDFIRWAFFKQPFPHYKIF